MKHVVQVTILGQQYTIRSEASPEEVARVAAFVNEKIDEVAAVGIVNTLNAAVLALLNVAGAYLRILDEGAAGGGREAEGRLRQILDRLERACPESVE